MASSKALLVFACFLLAFPALTQGTTESGSGSGSGDGVCDCLPCEVCVNGVCEVAPEGQLCAMSQGPCERNATCDGSSRICQRRFHDSFHICRPSVGGCDREDYCLGDNETCPETVRLGGEICRNSSGGCEQHALCDGETTICPANQLSLPGTLCSLSQGPCERNVTCTGFSATCTRSFVESGEICRPSDGSLCDAPDVCSGNSPECVDIVQPSTYECRSSSGSCEEPASCDGVAKDCPANVFVPAGTVCNTLCNVNYTCSGSSISCPSSPSPCSSHGSCSLNTCTCNTGFVGSSCSNCAPGRYGPSCAVCPGAGNCSGNGVCNEGIAGTGACACNAGYSGVSCSRRVAISLNASLPVDGQSTITIQLVDDLGGFPLINTSVFLNVDDSRLYRANSTSGSRLISVTNGLGTYVLSCSIYGFVRVTTVDTVGNNIIGASVNITFPNIATPEDDPAPGGAFVTGTVGIDGFPCSSLDNSVVGAFVSSMSTVMSLPSSSVSVLSVVCGGVLTPLTRRTTGTGLNIGVRLALPNETNVGPTLSLFTTVTTPTQGGSSPLLTSLLAQPTIQNIVSTTNVVLSIAPVVPQVAVSGVNCSADSWTPWSSCVFQRCGGGQGVQSRSRRCPAESQTRLCNAPPCGNCSVNNGGCHLNATCSLAVDNTAVCVCEAAFLGDGYSCFLRNSTSSLALIVTLFYPVQLSTIAPLAVDVLRLQSSLVSQALVILGTPSSRIAFSQLVPDVSGFYFIFSLSPPALTSDPNAVELQTTFSAGVTGGGMDLPSAGASLSSSTTSSSVFPSSGASSNSKSTNNDLLYIVVAIAAFFAFLALMLGLALLRSRRRSQDITPTKGPAWLSQPPKRSISLIEEDGAKKLTSRKSRNAIAPASSTSLPASPNAPGIVRSQPSQWEIEAIENDLPSIPAVRHYYPGWESSSSPSSKSPIASSPWI